MSVFLSFQPTKRTVRRLPRVIRIFDERLSKKSKILRPPISTPERGPNDREQTAPTTQQMTKRIEHAAMRESFFSSTRKATATSSIDMDEVKAATRRAKKKRMATNPPAGICENTYGSVSNTRPGPDCGSSPNAKTAGIMATPAMSANARSETAVAVL